jgi:hypothetical protein
MVTRINTGGIEVETYTYTFVGFRRPVLAGSRLTAGLRQDGCILKD